MSDKKTSWDYQKGGRYQQINIKFNMSDITDRMVYYYLTNKTVNASALIKKLVATQIWEDAYHER